MHHDFTCMTGHTSAVLSMGKFKEARTFKAVRAAVLTSSGKRNIARSRPASLASVWISSLSLFELVLLIVVFTQYLPWIVV
jgi:hypothetical protein